MSLQVGLIGAFFVQETPETRKPFMGPELVPGWELSWAHFGSLRYSLEGGSYQPYDTTSGHTPPTQKQGKHIVGAALSLPIHFGPRFLR